MSYGLIFVWFLVFFCVDFLMIFMSFHFGFCSWIASAERHEVPPTRHAVPASDGQVAGLTGQEIQPKCDGKRGLPVALADPRVHENRPRVGRSLQVVEFARAGGGHEVHCALEVAAGQRTVDLRAVAGDEELARRDGIREWLPGDGGEFLTFMPSNTAPH